MKKLPVTSCQLPVQKALCLRVFVSLCYALIFVLFSACVPAKVPDNLDDTPGPPVVVTDRVYESSQFSARYPQGWRVVTSEARTPPAVIFVAPDEVSTIRLMVGPLDDINLSEPDLQTEVRGLTLPGGLDMTVILSAPPDQWDALLPIFEHLLASVAGV